MHLSLTTRGAVLLAVLLAVSHFAHAAPVYTAAQMSDPTFGPIPGESDLYNTYLGTDQPFPAGYLDPIPPTATGPPAPDDRIWQNLLSAEWIVYSFYQAGVEKFNAASFTDLGFPSTTYQRIQEIRDNEAGHLRIFQDGISATQLKPGACKYQFPIVNPIDFLLYQTIIEAGSQGFLTGLVLEAQLNSTKADLVAIDEVETRHNSWALMDVWGLDPFVGPSDTAFPYAQLVLYTTTRFVVPGSCPSANPIFPDPERQLPYLDFMYNATTAQPGAPIEFVFTGPPEPAYVAGKTYYAVYFHGVKNYTMSFDIHTNMSTIPAPLDRKGVYFAVIADAPGAPTEDSIIAGPVIIPQQPSYESV